MFVDRIKVFVEAGSGGRGSVSFRREKFVPKGGPDGGDGGRGGDVILRADPQVDSLTDLFYQPLIKAKSGGHGMGKKMAGRSAVDKIVKVPMGTVVYRAEDATNASYGSQEPYEEKPLVDLTVEGQEFVICHGGDGGKGNVHFKSSRNRAPREYTEGEEGEQGHFLFELRTIADAGLVGYPNAGKSTLLRKVSAAKPKVAAYPFTTLHPIIGVVDLDEYRRVTIADIPGLIEGAHRGVGLGHEFLRHITRCRIFLFVVDIAGSEARDPVNDMKSLRREIDLYDSRLSERPWFIVANKIDLPDADENLKRLRKDFRKIEIVPVSAAKGEGIDALKEKLAGMLVRVEAPKPL